MDFWPRHIDRDQPAHEDPVWHKDGEWRLSGPMAKHVTEGVEEYVTWIHTTVAGKYESPIEERMGGALYGAFKDLLADDKTLIVPQAKIGPYRADLAIRLNHNLTGLRGIIVECDGREFHQDIARDRRRDAELRKRAFIVLRFTGSEIHKSARGCAESVRAHYDAAIRTGASYG